jgi:hypothetical protein
MPSSIQFAPNITSKAPSSSIYARPQKKQKMSITQTYMLAHSARGKLSKEASRADHDLRLLVGHANMLDSLMLDLASAEQEQEQWFNKSLSQSEEAVEDPQPDWEAEDAEDSDSDSDYDEDENMITPSTETPAITTTEVDREEEDFEEDEEEDYGDLALTRTISRHSPPELSSDSESDSEDEQMPPSPPSTTFDAFTEHQRQAIASPPKDTSLSDSQQQAFIEEGFFLPSRPQPHSHHQQPRPQPSMIAAF